MFNPRESDDDAALDEAIQFAISRATAPGQQSFGNSAGVSGGFSNLVVAPATITDTRPEIGTDEDGNDFFPFVVGVDYVNEPGVYIPVPLRIFDFGI